MESLIPKILDKLSEVAESQSAMRQELKDTSLKWDSWKDGQTLYMHKTTESIKGLAEKIRPIEDDYNERMERKRQEGSGWASVKFGIVQVMILALIFGIVMNAGSIVGSFKSYLTK